MAACIICDTCGLGPDAKEAPISLTIMTRPIPPEMGCEVRVDLCNGHFNKLSDGLPRKMADKLRGKDVRGEKVS